ncbi:fimbrial protein [Paraburkholderia youngii]|uniref:Major type 1 subunit fimbrin (Pilin) n=1 Tax=Paraburkholderia youngii TaxID=2782701 RepID=A0A7W8L8B2_9BURK|nr:fimbrial protein [Paraburkholderia youngii]MBB5402199.1 major type 1 subunit fimbrin (pilin) [Paraburkholderia youngii]NUX53955.1 type 1 fimbrial protein [Paraburkholderia youngii]NVI02221.1 type 1 fimbrial protein [Paraburkholderia youngii]
MKKQVTQLMIAVAGLSVAPMVFAQAAPGTGQVTFNGELIDDTCVINAGDDDKTVTLPTLSTQSLVAAGQTAGSRMFDISVSQCPATLTNVAAHFETTNMDPATRNAINQASTSPASNVEVQLLDSDGNTPILLGSTGSFVPVASNGTATMSYGGRYYATNKTTAGNVTAVVRYTLAYQ